MTTHPVWAARLAPKPYQVLRRLRATRPPAGEPFDITVEISEAFQIDGYPDWVCAMRIVGLDRVDLAEHGRAFFGVDPMQAIENALFLAHVELELAIEKYGLEWGEGGQYVASTLFRRTGEAPHQA